MKKEAVKNPNHPVKESKIKVEPIRKRKDIDRIKKMLEGNKRDLCLFSLGINTGLRASDLLRITAGMVRGVKADEDFELKEKKTGKLRRITLNKTAIEAVQGLLASKPYQDSDYLFQSQRREALTVQSVHRLVKDWCRAIKLRGNYGSHTLRKTWGYHQRVTFGRGLPELMEAFGHATQRQTLAYLCIQPEEIKSIYKNEL